MAGDLWLRLHWSLTLLLLSSFVVGLAVLTVRQVTRPEPLEVLLPTPSPRSA